MRYTQNFRIKRENLSKLKACLREICESETDIFTRFEKAAMRYSLDHENIANAIHSVFQVKPKFFGAVDEGEITGFEICRYVEAEHEALFAAIAPVIDPGSWVQIEYEYGNIRRYTFDGKRCISEPAVVTVPSDEKYVVLSQVVNTSAPLPENGKVQVHGSYEDERNAKRCLDAVAAKKFERIPVDYPGHDVSFVEKDDCRRAYVHGPNHHIVTVWIEKTTGLVPGIPAGE